MDFEKVLNAQYCPFSNDRKVDFDCPPQWAIAKPDAFDFNQSAIKLMHSYHSNRKQRTKVYERKFWYAGYFKATSRN